MPVAQAFNADRKSRAHTRRKASSPLSSSFSSSEASASAHSPSKRLRSPTPDEKATWIHALASRSDMCKDLSYLGDPVEYPFQLEDKVWVRTGKEIWCSGKICRKGFRVGQTRTKKGFYYHVQFGSRMHLRKFFAPMNGEIKPDTEAVRQILEQEGWIGEAGSGTDSSGDLYSD